MVINPSSKPTFVWRNNLMGKKQKMVKKVGIDRKYVDLFEIKLDGESDGEVPVYETCDAVRKKINTYLKSSNITRAGFLRAIGETHPKKKKFQ